MTKTKEEKLARRWMPGIRQRAKGDTSPARPAWKHPEDLAKLLHDLIGPTPDPGPEGPGGLPVSEREQHEYTRYRDQLVATAWLHDIIEDGRKLDGTEVTEEDLRAEGVEEIVIEDVVALTQREGEDKPVYLARLEAASSRAKLVKIVDRICNLREGKTTFKDARWARYLDETQKYIVPLLGGVTHSYIRLVLRDLLHTAAGARPAVPPASS
jgi:(p)ppGpp synthase/HD superfamily hydrolase